MEFRTSEDKIYEQVKKDTEAVLAQLPDFKPKSICTSVNLTTISLSLAKSIGERGVVLIDSIDEMKQVAIAAHDSNEKDKEDNWLLFTKSWIGRLVRAGRTLSSHAYSLAGVEGNKDIRDIGLRVEIQGSSLQVVVLITDMKWNQYKVVNLLGKPSRVLNKIFGVGLVTHMCQHHPIKGTPLELHFSKSYIPELYRMISRDEDMSSCMSKHSADYDLDDCFHPTMPYENSKNAVLALLYNMDKKRYVGRTIAALELRKKGEVNFSTAYGTSGTAVAFRAAGLVEDDNMDGMELSVIDTDEGVLLPYVDGNTQRVSGRGDVWVVDSGGDTEGSYESGRVIEGFTCNCCEEQSTGEQYYTTDDGCICEYCRNNSYILLDNGDVVHHDYAAFLADEDCYIHINDTVYCEHSGGYYRDSEPVVEVRYRGGFGEIYKTILVRYLSEYIEDGNLISVDGEPYVQEEEEAA